MHHLGTSESTRLCVLMSLPHLQHNSSAYTLLISVGSTGDVTDMGMICGLIPQSDSSFIHAVTVLDATQINGDPFRADLSIVLCMYFPPSGIWCIAS